jgi:hypothetical protein
MAYLKYMIFQILTSSRISNLILTPTPWDDSSRGKKDYYFIFLTQKLSFRIARSNDSFNGETIVCKFPQS